MPWTAKQLKLFRAAAHNPAIAKSSGIKQADAERMSKEGLKKMAGGGKAVVNKQDTRHGKMDMPFNKLNRFAGMKSGGMMKKGRTFARGGDLDRLGEVGESPKKSFADAFASARRSGDKTFMWRGKEYGTEIAKPAAKPAETGNERRSRLDVSRFQPSLTNQRLSMEDMGIGSGMKKGGNVKRFAKGGMMKESKAMVGKEVAFMKKKGAPASMIKHEAAEMGAMKKGGMAKYARGGGIESKGKTKGTMIKMAAGGLAGGHKSADGIAQRGKTKARTVTMKGGGYC